MAEYRVQLSGWKAIAGVVAVLGLVGGTMALRIRTVDDAMRQAVRVYLLNEYSGRGPKDVTRLLAESRQGLPVEALPEVAPRDVQLPSLAARGKMGGPVTIVRAEITVDGGAPPDGRAVRYFRMSRGLEGMWFVDGESDSFRYFQELMP
jgi:hypothetical protein